LPGVRRRCPRRATPSQYRGCRSAGEGPGCGDLFACYCLGWVTFDDVYPRLLYTYIWRCPDSTRRPAGMTARPDHRDLSRRQWGGCRVPEPIFYREKSGLSGFLPEKVLSTRVDVQERGMDRETEAVGWGWAILGDRPAFMSFHLWWLRPPWARDARHRCSEGKLVSHGSRAGSDPGTGGISATSDETSITPSISGRWRSPGR
jgi:hypothetical protein